MDWKLGRYIVPNTRILQGTAVTLPANRQRVGVSIWGFDDGGQFGIRPQGTAFTFIANVANINGNPYHMTLATHGRMVSESMVFQTITGNGFNCLVTEYLMPEWMLAMADKELAASYPAMNIPPKDL